MNAPTKHPTLDDLRAARGNLLRQEAGLWRRRVRLEELEREAEKAERALQDSRPMSSSSIENWQAAGAVGPFPGVDSVKLAQLREAAASARNTLAAVAIARAEQEQQADVIAKELELSRIAIESHGGHLREAS